MLCEKIFLLQWYRTHKILTFTCPDINIVTLCIYILMQNKPHIFKHFLIIQSFRSRVLVERAPWLAVRYFQQKIQFFLTTHKVETEDSYNFKYLRLFSDAILDSKTIFQRVQVLNIPRLWMVDFQISLYLLIPVVSISAVF